MSEYREDLPPSRDEIRYAHISGYRLPTRVRHFLRTRMIAYANRPRMMLAIPKLATIIGRYQCGPENFVSRGCGIGGEGSGFFLARTALAKHFPDRNFTEALIREAIKFLLAIGFIERITPKGELAAVKRPKNATDCSELGYFRTCVKATKDDLGRIRAPVVMYRLAAVTRTLFSETLRLDRVRNAEKLQEPVCENNLISALPVAVQTREGLHTGSTLKAEYDRCEHDLKDPRFDYHRPDPMKDPHHGVRTIGRRNLGPWGLPDNRPQPQRMPLGEYQPRPQPTPLAGQPAMPSRAEIAADLEHRRRDREAREGRGRPAIPKLMMLRPVFAPSNRPIR